MRGFSFFGMDRNYSHLIAIANPQLLINRNSTPINAIANSQHHPSVVALLRYFSQCHGA